MTASGSSRANDAWSANVRTLLRDGLGADDIALRLHCAAADVRAEIRILRAEGVLATLWGQA